MRIRVSPSFTLNIQAQTNLNSNMSTFIILQQAGAANCQRGYRNKKRICSISGISRGDAQRRKGNRRENRERRKPRLEAVSSIVHDQNDKNFNRF
jgi:guanylate kinase